MGERIRLPLFACSALALALALVPVSPAFAAPAGGLRILRSRTQPQALRRAPQFPHLLVARERPGARTGLLNLRSNAIWDPGGRLPPSILPRDRVERARALLGAGSQQDFSRLLRQSLAGGQPTTVRILALRVDFRQDTPGSKTTGDGRFMLAPPADSTCLGPDPPPHDKRYFASQLEALRRYYDVQTHGRLKLEWEVFPAEEDSAYHLPDTFKYGPWVFSNSNPDVYEHAIDLVGDALAEADSARTIDFRKYQSVILFHAGADFQGDISGDSPWDIPSFNVYVQDPFIVHDASDADSVGINLVMVVPETVTQDGFLGTLNGVVAHEFGHQLGFFDLYDVISGGSVVGAFSLMDSGPNLIATTVDTTCSPAETLSVRGILPSGLDPVHKLLFFPDGVSWHQEEDYVTADQDSFRVTLPAAEIRNDMLYVPLDQNEPTGLGPWGEFLLLENRKEDLNGDLIPTLKRDPHTHVVLGPDSSAAGDTLGLREYDYLLPGEGILTWHVDWNAILAGLSLPNGGVNIYFSRPGVGVVEADGIRDIGTTSEEYLGGKYDPYFVGGYTRLGPDTRPNSNTNDGTPSGVSFTVLDSVALAMRVKVESRQLPGGWPVTFLGNPTEEQILATDLDGDGAPEILSAAQEVILAWKSDGTPIHGWDGGPRFALLPGPIVGPIALQESFPLPSGPGKMLAAVANGTVSFVDGTGTVVGAWPPEGTQGVCQSVTLLDSVAVVSCTDGRVRVLRLDDGGVSVAADPLLADRTVRVVGAGREARGGPVHVFWAADDGLCGAFLWSAAGGVTGQWSAASESRSASGRALAVLAEPDPSTGWHYFFAWNDGTVEWRGSDGRLLDGWPVRLGDAMAGQPILCDAAHTGTLETVLVTENGTLHALDWKGVDLFGWPRSIWSEDFTYRPPQESGPRAWDVTGDGAPEILVQRSDGYLLALETQGREAPGWPLSFGRNGHGGPIYIPAGGGYEARLVVGTDSWQGSGKGALCAARIPGVTAEGPGLFPAPGVSFSRARVYPAAWIPSAVSAPGDLVAGSVYFYPNPLRGNRLTVRFVLGEPATIDLEAFDLAGARKARMEAQGKPGADGNQLYWDLSSLAPGLYHVRLRAAGDGFRREVYQKLAIIR